MAKHPLICLALFCLCAGPALAGGLTYVGSKACAECHQEEYDSFQKDSKKPHSFRGVEKMRSDLKPEELKGCYACHTTGYGKPGGFVDPKSTPDLADVGCETCHGPGSAHAAAGDPGSITRKPDLKACLDCHSAERIGDFNFKPLLYSGAHK
ncbi:MAG: cytochrome c family protein [Thermodesulfobacteriota bacterium]